MSETRKVLYVGDLQPDGTSFHRKCALERLGFIVTPFDTYPYIAAGSRIARSGRYRMATGPIVWKLNKDLAEAAKGAGAGWIWVDKGVWITPQTVAAVSAHGLRSIHYGGDPMILFHKTRHFLNSIPFYDIIVTTKQYEVELYERHGAKRVLLLLHGYDEDLFYPFEPGSSESDSFGSDVCFVGHHEPHYRRLIGALANAGVDVAVWGRWQRAAIGRPWLAGIIRGPGVWNRDYATVLNGAKIGLGLLTRLAPDQSTTRTFEIAACGTFLLAERTREHSQLFEEGKEAEFFSNSAELLEKTRWYLDHDAERRQIAAAGRERCIRSGYTYRDRMHTAVSLIQSHLE